MHHQLEHEAIGRCLGLVFSGTRGDLGKLESWREQKPGLQMPWLQQQV